jgi:hypothetical protein
MNSPWFTSMPGTPSIFCAATLTGFRKSSSGPMNSSVTDPMTDPVSTSTMRNDMMYSVPSNPMRPTM